MAGEPIKELTDARKQWADALVVLAEDLIRAGADPEIVQKFVDDELARMEAKEAKQ